MPTIASSAVHVAELKSKPRNVVGIFRREREIGGGLPDHKTESPYSGFNHTLLGEIGHMVLDVNGPKMRLRQQKVCF